ELEPRRNSLDKPAASSKFSKSLGGFHVAPECCCCRGRRHGQTSRGESLLPCPAGPPGGHCRRRCSTRVQGGDRTRDRPFLYQVRRPSGSQGPGRGRHCLAGKVSRKQ